REPRETAPCACASESSSVWRARDAPGALAAVAVTTSTKRHDEPPTFTRSAKNQLGGASGACPACTVSLRFEGPFSVYVIEVPGSVTSIPKSARPSSVSGYRPPASAGHTLVSGRDPPA